jgi:hypothetical protein
MKHNHRNSPHHDHNKIEYLKFAVVLVMVTSAAWLHTAWYEVSLRQFLGSYMGVFFVVFASFKLYNLKEFAYGFQSYAIMKNRSVVWGFFFPFVQLTFGVLYLLGRGGHVLDSVVLVWSGANAYLVWATLQKKDTIFCVCLGSVIKLPLSTISFVEDFGMAIMALAMIILR